MILKLFYLNLGHIAGFLTKLKKFQKNPQLFIFRRQVLFLEKKKMNLK